MALMKSIKDFFQYMSFTWEKPAEIYLGETKYPSPIFRSEVDSRFEKRMIEKKLDDEELPNDTIWRIDAKYKAVIVYCHIKTAFKVPDKRELKDCIFNFFEKYRVKHTEFAHNALIKRKANGLVMIGDTDFTTNGDKIESFSLEDEKTIRLKVSIPYKVQNEIVQE